VRVTFEDGNQAWSSPIYLVPPEFVPAAVISERARQGAAISSPRSAS
jgi:hypothetical protein